MITRSGLNTKYPLLYSLLKRFAYPIIKLRECKSKLLIYQAPGKQKKALAKLKGKKKIRCVFFVLNEAGWKYDGVFQLMIKNERFEPIILVCPMRGYGNAFMHDKLKECYNFFFQKGYHTLSSYNDSDSTYLNVREQLSPDIIFYCSPYSYTIDRRYFITEFPDILSIYVPYTYNNVSDHQSFQNELLHNLVWRYYAETKQHVEYSKKYADNRGRNVVLTGYPAIDIYMRNDYMPSKIVWKIQNPSIKRIIWAPHHTIIEKGSVIFSCFLKYSEFMIRMANKYQEKVQFILKPHPLLRPKLNNYWGKKKTDDYFNIWLEMPNSTYNEGSYEDMFITSDAMIHDSGSFIAEYLHLNKPVLRTMNDQPLDMYDDVARACIKNHYKAYNERDIECFINMVIKEEDPMLKDRTDFVENVLKPKGIPSENIVNDIIDSIDNQILYRN